jgi:hypothetical protein
VFTNSKFQITVPDLLNSCSRFDLPYTPTLGASLVDRHLLPAAR